MTKFDIIIFATITISVAFASTIPENVNRDNCQYAPGNWIGNGNKLTPCHCQTYGVHWYVEDFSGDATTLAMYYKVRLIRSFHGRIGIMTVLI